MKRTKQLAKKTKNKLKVAFIVGEFPDKIGSFILNQATGLLDLGVDLKIYSLMKPEKEVISEEIKKYKLMEKVYYVNVPRSKILRVLKATQIVLKNIFKHPIKIWKPLNFLKYGKPALTLNPFYFTDYFLNLNEKFDIIHCHFGQRGLYGAALKEACIGGKLVTSFYGGDLSSFVKDVGKEAYKPLFDRGNLFLPLSENFKDLLIELGCKKNKIKVQPIIIDIKILKRKKSGNKVKILMVARFVEKKGHKYLIEAMEKVVKNNTNVILDLVGDGVLKSKIESSIKEKGLERYIKIHGTITYDKLPNLYSEADIYVQPSVRAKDGDMEGTPVSIMEAQASGIPVIATNHSGIPERVKDGETGFLVHEKNAEEIAEKIIFLINNPRIREKMGAKAKKYIKNNYQKKVISKKLIKLYEDLLKNKGD